MKIWFTNYSFKGDDIEVAITHSKSQYSEEYHSFVNEQKPKEEHI
jgi:topoisomerase-4 subunit B